MKRGLNAFAKSIGPSHPARTVQADMSRSFSLSFDFLNAKRPFHISQLSYRMGLFGSTVAHST